MKDLVVIGTVLGITAAMGGGLFAGYQLIRGDDPYVFRSADPKTVAAMPASVLCKPATSRDELGPVVGGPIARGDGDRDAATTAAAGAVAGSSSGRSGRAC